MHRKQKHPSNPALAGEQWKHVYLVLLDLYGPQGWWPITPKGGTHPQYHPGEWPILTKQQQYEVFLGAILTQNTAWRNVEKALSRLRSEGISLPEQLFQCATKDVEEWIRPSGYYRQKAARLINTSRDLVRLGGMDALRKMDLKRARRVLLSWNGIGEETADSILLYGLNKVTFVVDAYTRRLRSRLRQTEEEVSTQLVQNQITHGLPRKTELYGEFHALIVAHAKSRCTKANPHCVECPLLHGCSWGKRLQ